MSNEMKWQGGGIPYGYRYDELKSMLIPDKNEYEVLRVIISLRKEGYGVNRIANTLNARGLLPRRGRDWTASIVSYILTNDRLKFYAGLDKNGEIGNWKPLISDRELEQLMQKTSKESTQDKTAAKKRKHYLLSGIGLLKCGYCGSNVKASITTYKGKKSLYYCCSRRQNAGKAACKESKLHRQEKIDSLVITDLKERTSHDSLDIINKYVLESKGSYRSSITKAFSSFSEKFFARISENNTSGALLTLESGLAEIKDLFKKLEDISVPVKYEEANIENTLMSNISSIILFNDYIEIIYKFPIDASLSYSQHLIFTN